MSSLPGQYGRASGPAAAHDAGGRRAPVAAAAGPLAGPGDGRARRPRGLRVRRARRGAGLVLRRRRRRPAAHGVPGRRGLRLVSVLSHVERIGLDAMPIVGLLSFLIGVVLAYQGADQLRAYGAEIFTINLLGVSVLRELGVLLTVDHGRRPLGQRLHRRDRHDEGQRGGRRAEDARPRPGRGAGAAAPAGDDGGAAAARLLRQHDGAVRRRHHGADRARHLARRSSSTSSARRSRAKMFWVGIVKAPFFAFLIAMVGCYEGLQVVGQRRKRRPADHQVGGRIDLPGDRRRRRRSPSSSRSSGCSGGGGGADHPRARAARRSSAPQVVHDNLDLDVRRGEILALVGGSGTGKSVLMRTMIGLKRPEGGTVDILGRDLWSADEADAARDRAAMGRPVPERRAVQLPDGGAEHPRAVQGARAAARPSWSAT